MRENYIPVLTRDGRPLAPCHPRRAKGLVANGKASFKHKSGIRCIVIHKTNIPKVKRASKLVLRIDPGRRTTGIALTRDHKDGSRTCPHRHRGETPGQGHIHQNDQAQTQEADQTRKENALPPAQVQQPDQGTGLATSQHPVKTPKHPNLGRKTEQNASNRRNPRRDQRLRPSDTPQPRNQGKAVPAGTPSTRPTSEAPYSPETTTNASTAGRAARTANCNSTTSCPDPATERTGTTTWLQPARHATWKRRTRHWKHS